MVDFFNPLHVNWEVWLLTLLVAFLAGVSKSGIKGIVMIGIPILATLYGAKLSTGILLPFLIFGDIIAIHLYLKYAKIGCIIKLLPYAIGGIIIAVVAGKFINDRWFTNIMAVVMLVCVILILLNDLRKGSTDGVVNHRLFSPIFGLTGGFATMIGNLAGPIFNLYLITIKLPKKEFIGTGASFYLILNLIKIPFHFFVWETITLSSLQMNVVMLPAVIGGAFLGSWLVKLIPEKVYRYLILCFTSLSALLLFFK